MSVVLKLSQDDMIVSCWYLSKYSRHCALQGRTADSEAFGPFPPFSFLF